MYVMSFLPLRDAFHYAIMEGHFPYAEASKHEKA